MLVFFKKIERRDNWVLCHTSFFKQRLFSLVSTSAVQRTVRKGCGIAKTKLKDSILNHPQSKLQKEFSFLCDEVKILSFTFKLENVIQITSLKFITNSNWQRKTVFVKFSHP